MFYNIFCCVKVLEIELETESCVCFFLYEEILLCLVHDIYMWSVHPRKEREREDVFTRLY